MGRFEFNIQFPVIEMEGSDGLLGGDGIGDNRLGEGGITVSVEEIAS